MKRLKITGLCLVAVCSAFALSATSALAASNEYKSQFQCYENVHSVIGCYTTFAPNGMAFNHLGDVWVAAEYENIQEYPEGGSNKPLKEISLGFENYGDIAVNGNNDLFVANYGGESVAEYSSTGSKLYEITGAGTTSHSFQALGVAVDSSGNLYVPDIAHGVVDEFSEPTGSGAPTPVKEFTVANPEEVAVNSSDDLYVVSGTVVDEFNPAGSKIEEITGTGSPNAEGETPQKTLGSYIDSLAVAPDGEVYIDNATEGLVNRFKSTGKYLGQFSGSEAPPAYSFGAAGLAVNASGEVYVGDSAHGYVDIFSAAEVIVEKPVNTGVPVVSGTAKEGKTLSTSNGTWTNSPESYTYKWEDCEAGGGPPCTPIAGATAHEYTLTSNDVGKTVRSVVTATNTGGSSAPADSVASAEVVAAGNLESENKTEVYGEVPETTTLNSSGCDPNVYLGEFIPGVEANYPGTCNVTVTATGEVNTLTASDESSTCKGHLTQEPTHPYCLAKALQVRAEDTEHLGGVGKGLESLSPVTLLSYPGPVSADNVLVEFSQPIGKHDPLHTGKYGKIITLTLAQTTP